jgi:copper(I)-binding protein
MKTLSICAGLLLSASTALAQHDGSGAVHVMSAWSRALPPVSENGAVYLTLKNYAEVPDRLLGASTPVARQVEFHTHAMEAGMMTMRRVETIVLDPGEYVRFEPGGKHLMLIGLKQPLKEGEQIPLTLEFENASPLEVTVTIRPLGATGPVMDDHDHSGMHGHHKKHEHKSP